MVEETDDSVVATDLRMPGIDGLTLMVRIRAIRSATTFVVITGAGGGLAIFPEAAQPIDALVRCTDKAMYTAKAKGRNRLHLYDPASADTPS